MYRDMYGLMLTSEIGAVATADTGYGAYSYARGVARAVRQALRRSGFFGECEKLDAEFEDKLLEKILEFMASHPDATMDAFDWFVSNNINVVVGRFGAGAAYSSVVGPRYGLPTTGVAIWGDAATAVEHGVNTVEGMVEAALGGVINDMKGKLDNCVCEN